MEKGRQDPDELLRIINQDRLDSSRGHCKIFFGYAAGVGKTYAMLEAAHQLKERGVDVVCGYIEAHDRLQTTSLLTGLEQLKPHIVQYKEMSLKEFDLDAALQRKPQLILVDELAHTNAPNSRHIKRYQDIEELLKAGIDVYTTLNVQHIESLHDTIASITQISVQERIPDSVFDLAEQVELVDIEPKELLERLALGHIYKEKQAELAAKHFFTFEHLTALREIALRRCADRVNLRSENIRIINQSFYHTEEHILVCLSSSPSSAKTIRTAARMANAFRSTFTALYVETHDFSSMSEKDQDRLRTNIRLAQQLGAHIETVYGDDVPYQIAQFARVSGVSKIIVGRSTVARKHLLSKPSLTERLILYSPDLDIYIIPDVANSSAYQLVKYRISKLSLLTLSDVLKSFVILLIATLLGIIFYEHGNTDVNIIMFYILGVLIISILIANPLCSLLSSAISVLIFNFFFTDPQFTFHVQNKGYLVTFIIMFISSFLTGSLASKLKKSAKQSASIAYRTSILFETNQILQKCQHQIDVLASTANQLIKLLRKDIVMYLADEKGLSEPFVYRCEDSSSEMLTNNNERAVAAWVQRNNKHAGASTDTLCSSKCLYLSIRVNDQVYGVVGIAIGNSVLDFFENSVLLSILGECALALENLKNAHEKQQTAILAKNEQLRANLLRAVSHDLRTPLTTISGNAEALLNQEHLLDDTMKIQLYSDIYNEAIWLNHLVENLLSVSRIEEGSIKLNYSIQLIDEIISEALCHINRNHKKHNILVDIQEMILVRVDVRLILQVIINIIDNALKFTSEDSTIIITVQKQLNQVLVSIADDGPGISDENKAYVFDMFYTGNSRITDSKRSLGLGLSLCKSIITAHDGSIHVADNSPNGTIFTFYLPVEEAPTNE